MTILLALVHAFRTNKNFDPFLLYFGTLLLDIELISRLL